MKSVLAGVLLVVAVAFADAACRRPQQFSGSYASFIYSISGSKLQQAVYGHIIYDGPHRRQRIDGRDDGGNPYVFLQFFEEGKQYYTIKGKCYSGPVRGDFHNFEIPDGAKLVNEGLVGFSPNTLYIQRYFGVKEGVKFLATVTRDNCMLTSAVAHKDDTIVYASMTGVKLGIDQSKFTKPEGCHDIGTGARRRRGASGFIPDNPLNIVF